jgi:membrane associated rhomboid family serine protease
MIGVWILTQIASVFFLQEDTAGGGVAFWAHIGGFVAGLLLSFVLRGRETGSPSPRFAR